jgi:hypothetical protein
MARSPEDQERVLAELEDLKKYGEYYSGHEKRIKEGKCLIKGFFILKWKYCAAIIIAPINIAEIVKGTGYHMLTMSKVAKDILTAPIKDRVKSLNPNDLNSFIILSYLKIQTKATENATIICAN